MAIAPALALAALSAGCADTIFDAITPAPPSRTAELDGSDRITLSRGVALAFECTYGVYEPGDETCGAATIRSRDLSIAGAWLGHAEELYDTPQWADTPSGQLRTRFVVVGFAAGSTTLDVHTERGDRRLDVTVIDP